MVLPACLVDRDRDDGAAAGTRPGRFDALDDRLDRDRRIPHLERTHPGVPTDPSAIPPRGQPGDVAAGRLAESVLARRDHDARREAFQVPFPWTSVGLVEVVDIEDEPPLGARKDAEV